MALEKEGYRVTYLPVDREGLLKLADLENAITDETAVVSLMWANIDCGRVGKVTAFDEFQAGSRHWWRAVKMSN